MQQSVHALARTRGSRASDERWALDSRFRGNDEREANGDEAADRLRDLQFLRAVPRGLSRIRRPPNPVGTTSPLRDPAGKVHGVRGVPRLLPGSRRTGAISGGCTVAAVERAHLTVAASFADRPQRFR